MPHGSQLIKKVQRETDLTVDSFISTKLYSAVILQSLPPVCHKKSLHGHKRKADVLLVIALYSYYKSEHL